MGFGVIFGLGIVSMFWPSPALFNIYLYGGLLLFGAFMLYDMQKIIYNAKLKPVYDPINESIGIYLDTIIIFQKFLIIFM